MWIVFTFTFMRRVHIFWELEPTAIQNTAHSRNYSKHTEIRSSLRFFKAMVRNCNSNTVCTLYTLNTAWKVVYLKVSGQSKSRFGGGIRMPTYLQEPANVWIYLVCRNPPNHSCQLMAWLFKCYNSQWSGWGWLLKPAAPLSHALPLLVVQKSVLS